MQKAQRNGFGIVGIILIIAAVAVLGGGAGYLLYPKKIYIGNSGFILPEDIYYYTKYKCLGFTKRTQQSPDFGGDLLCFGLRYNKQCFKSVGQQEGAQIPCGEIHKPPPPPDNYGVGRKMEEAIEDVAAWKTYRNEKYGFEFKYPPDFERQSASSEPSRTLSFGGRRGGIGFDILERKLDIKNIQGPFGKVDNPQLVQVGSQNGYKIAVADVGCSGWFIHTAVKGKILQIKFTSCEGDTDPIGQDEATMNQILSTFKFVKENLQQQSNKTISAEPPISSATPPSKPSVGPYSGFFGFPEKFFAESVVQKEQMLKAIDAQYQSLKKMHNGITPYAFARIEYDPPVYGTTIHNGIRLGDSAFPGLNSGHPRWEVMAHEQGHNFFGGTSAWYNTLAVPGPFLQESLAVLSAFYTYHNILDNSGSFGLDAKTIESLKFDFINGRNYQKGQYEFYISQGKKFDDQDVLTSQALDYKMIVYGEMYGWQNYLKLTKAFKDGISSQFTFQNNGVSAVERSTYVVVLLGAVFGKDFRAEFRDLNFPIDDFFYAEIYPKIQNYIQQ